ncbi:glycosyltransferase [Ktedonobacter racemifer]|uniref:Glycosyl transferase group 1 n=1 Tax=Ktedonobacter racemifer DSM 44963 TaxID=485913 RepID=D6TQ98_KTERA|nr:glycosyltransferase [Ktedonobacter racemifer]EFH85746.1 glycosyl transferase group 1 [Ktedonobacter racemifer DSM 44963]
MHILFVAPYPLSRIRIRSYGFVSQLAKRHDVTALVLCSNKREVRDVQALRDDGLAIYAVEDKRVWKVWRTLRAIFTSQPLQVAFDASPRLCAALNEHMAGGDFDLVHVEFIRALGALPQEISLPVVWDAVDCISMLYEQGTKYGATPMLRLIGKSEAARTRAYEYTQLRRFQHVLVTSPRDQEALRLIAQDAGLGADKRPPAPITVLPHGVDQEYYQYYQGERQPDMLIFSGKMSFHANVAGALHLAKNIMPLIWRERPQVRLVIAGSKPPASVRSLARDPRVDVTGYIDDLRSFIREAHVAVCPLPYAVGVQNKALEAMALGTPVVASSHVTAGLKAVPGQDILVADEPELFAQAVLCLLDDQALWQTISQNGHMYIEKHHNWKHIVNDLTSIYAQSIYDTNASLFAQER